MSSLKYQEIGRKQFCACVNIKAHREGSSQTGLTLGSNNEYCCRHTLQDYKCQMPLFKGEMNRNLNTTKAMNISPRPCSHPWKLLEY